MKAKILGLMAVALLAGPMAANALVITISGQGAADGQWSVATTVGLFDDLLPTLGTQVWWHSESLANAFASTVGAGLGLPVGGYAGPNFAYSEFDSSVFLGCAYFDSTGVTCGVTTRSIAWPFVTATRVPEPGTLALLGLGLAGLGLTRRRKAA